MESCAHFDHDKGRCGFLKDGELLEIDCDYCLYYKMKGSNK